MDYVSPREPSCADRQAVFAAAKAGIPGSDAIQGVIERWQRRHRATDEWDDWLDGDEHADSDEDDDGE